MDIKKLEDAVTNLENACPETMDIADVFGVCVDDLADLFRSKTKAQFMKQKRDAKRSLKHLYRKLNNMTFKNVKK